MISKEAIESAYCIFHQKLRVYEYSNSTEQKDEIENAISSYVNDMSSELYRTLAQGRDGYLMEHASFLKDLKEAVVKLEQLLGYGQITTK